VTGNKKYSSEDIIKQTGIVTGFNVFKMLGENPKNLMSFRFNNNESKLYASLPYIKNVSIRPGLPKSIKVKIEERVPFAVLQSNGEDVLVDRDGYALEELKKTSAQNKKSSQYIKIIGTSVDSIKLGQVVKFKGRSPFVQLTKFSDIFLESEKDSKTKLYGKMTAIDMSDQNNITAIFDNRITVRFGNAEDADDVKYNLEFFRQLYVNNITEKQKGTVDFTTGNNPYFAPDD
jgi:cell division protein FtsQ